MPSFIKLDSFYSKSIKLIEDKLSFAYTCQGGIVRPIFGSKVTHINDRFFVTNSFGYTHLGHSYKSNTPIKEEVKEESTGYKKVMTGDDLGS